MCGIAGFCNGRRDLSTPEWRQVGADMAQALRRRGPNDRGVWQSEGCVLAHRRLAVIDPDHGAQPMVRRMGEAEFVLCYNGELYNTPALRRELEGAGYVFETNTDTEALLYACMEYGDGVCAHLEGIFAFAFWDGARRRLLCGRDRFGVKPFFYAVQDGAFLFASEPKALFRYPGFRPEADGDTWRELMGIAPARTPEKGVFAGIRALEPAHMLSVEGERIRTWRYWELVSRPHQEGYEDTVAHVGELLTSAIRRQLVSDVPLCVFLSGGLDSSIVAAVAAREYAAQGRPPLETYSFDYTDNQRYFKASSFQPDADWPWVERMREAFHTRHRALTCGIQELVDCLDEAVDARDLPGMADVDASLLFFCRQIAQRQVVAISAQRVLCGGTQNRRTSAKQMSFYFGKSG